VVIVCTSSKIAVEYVKGCKATSTVLVFVIVVVVVILILLLVVLGLLSIISDTFLSCGVVCFYA